MEAILESGLYESCIGGGSGKMDDPCLANTARDLKELAERVNSGLEPFGLYYKLTADIDMSAYGASFNGGKGWAPIGRDFNHPFTGYFDGDGKTVSNLFIDDGELDNAGLFGLVEGGTVENLAVVDVNIYARNNVGGVAGSIDNGGCVHNCHASGKVSGDQNIGGVAGLVDNNGRVSNCRAEGEVSGDQNTGGAAGLVENNGRVINCRAACKVSGNGYYVGGVAGWVGANSSVEDCFAAGEVSGGSSAVGGVAGYVSKSKVDNCRATCDVRGNYVGGVAGFLDNSSLSDCRATGDVSSNSFSAGGVAGFLDNSVVNNCCAAGKVSGGSFSAGGVVGYAHGSRISNSYATGDISGANSVGGVAGDVLNSNISNSYATGKVRGVGSVGGVAGYVSTGSSINNCYTTSDVSGFSVVGGVAGYLYNGSSVTGCAALNSTVARVSGPASAFGRVVGGVDAGGMLNNNVALEGMDLSTTGAAVVSNGSGKHGANIASADAKLQTSYTVAALKWAFGDGAANPWKWGGESHPLPVLHWGAEIPASLPGHLR